MIVRISTLLDQILRDLRDEKAAMEATVADIKRSIDRLQRLESEISRRHRTAR